MSEVRSAPRRTLDRLATAWRLGEPVGDACLNCEAALVGPYCAQCGQRALPPRPTARELVGEAWSELVALDGRVASTLRLLLTRPGALTRETWQGRRARYVGPIRLYLLCSLAYFFASAVLPEADAAARRHRARVEVSERTGVALPPSCRPAGRPVGAIVRRMRDLDCKTDREPARFEAARRANVPRLMFVLLPLYAGLLALAFRGHTFPEHLVFALHLHAFVFLAMLVPRATDALAAEWVDGVVGLVAWTAIAVYAVLALRRSYGRSWRGTLVRSVVVGATYGLLFFVGFVAMMLVVAATM